MGRRTEGCRFPTWQSTPRERCDQEGSDAHLRLVPYPFTSDRRQGQRVITTGWIRYFGLYLVRILHYPTTSVKISKERESWDLNKFASPSNPHFYGSWDKCKNLYPLRICIIPNSANTGVQERRDRRPSCSWPPTVAKLEMLHIFSGS